MKWNIFVIIVGLLVCSGCQRDAYDIARRGIEDASPQAAAIQGGDDIIRWADEAARWADDAARRGADEAAPSFDDFARREGENVAPWFDDAARPGSKDVAATVDDLVVIARRDALVSEITGYTEYAKEGGCSIVSYAALFGFPPSEEEVHEWVYTYVPAFYGRDYQMSVDEELTGIRGMVEDILQYTDDHEEAIELLVEVLDRACE